MAFMWMGQLVDAPIAEATAIAFSNAALVMIALGVRSSWTISTIRRPVAYAICARSRYGAGIAAHPGSDIPTASARTFIDKAVPMVLQWPALGAAAATMSMNSA